MMYLCTPKTDLLHEIDNFKKQATIIFNTRELHEQALLKHQSQCALFFENVFKDLESKINNLTPLNVLEDVKKSSNTVVSLFLLTSCLTFPFFTGVYYGLPY